MGKVVKYCSSCDEGFAERFAFCPTCGATLQAFQMNPVAEESAVTEKIETRAPEIETAPAAVTFYEAAEPVAEIHEPEMAAGHIDEQEAEISEPVEEVPATISVPAADNVFVSSPMHADEPRSAFFAPQYERGEDDGYYITVIEEKNVKQRNVLLLGSAVFCVAFAVFWTGWSLWSKDYDIAAIDNDKLFSAVIVDDPMVTEDEPEQKKDDDEDGGGGGGGKEEPDPVSRGDLPDQSRNPIRPPDPNTFRSDNFELKTPIATTEGERKFPKLYGQHGDPNSKFLGVSSGPGSGGGMGTGTGTGVGSGRGTGTGSGTGSGYGSGTGDGDGDGDGSGGREAPPAVRAVTEPLKILAKPKALYTDAARTNNFTGVARLKVTLLASGQVGSISALNRLPHGLTEQAISAARQIRFQPKKVNGVAQSVIMTFEYSFSLY